MGCPRKIPISAVIPACDEERSIARCVTSLEATLAAISPRFEIVVVDDGSRDRTGAILRRLAASRPWLRVLTHERNRGLGCALRAGFLSCRGELIFYTDADLPYDHRTLLPALALLAGERADVVAGFRQEGDRDGWLRVLCSWVYNHLVRALFGIRTPDVGCGFRLMRRARLRQISLRSRGAFLGAELLVRAQRAGWRIRSLPLDYHPPTRGGSRVATPRNVARILADVIGLWAEPRRTRAAPWPARASAMPRARGLRRVP